MSHILFVDQYPEMGGGQTILLSLLQAAQSTGAQVTLLAPPGGALEDAVRALDGNIVFVPCEELHLAHGRKSLRDVFALLTYGWRFTRYLPLLRKQNIIHVNGLRHLPHIMLFSLFLRSRILYHLHIKHSRMEKLLLRLAACLPATFRLIANSNFIAKDFKQCRKLVLIENALDNRFARLAFNDRFTHASSWVAAVAGTLRPEKGQDVAIAAVPSDMRLHLIGREGDGAGAWIAYLKQNVGSNIHFEGPTADVARVLTAVGAQFALVPSRWHEPFGLAAIEGMACSCLTIVSGAGGLAEIAEKTGALVARDAPALATLLAELRLRPAADLAALARTQFEATQHHYAPQRFRTEIRALLEQAFTAS